MSQESSPMKIFTIEAIRRTPIVIIDNWLVPKGRSKSGVER